MPASEGGRYTGKFRGPLKVFASGSTAKAAAELPHSKRLGELVPKGGFAGSEERVFTRVPAEKMRRAGVGGMVLAGSPNFME